MEDYGNAISNALGGAMYHIVSADERAARGAIAFLKKNRGGRAAFLPMSVLEPYVAEEQLVVAQHCEGFLGKGQEFVEYDLRYDVVAEALLGNVLVCDQLEHVMSWPSQSSGYGFKIVTLDGDIVPRKRAAHARRNDEECDDAGQCPARSWAGEREPGRAVHEGRDVRARFKALSGEPRRTRARRWCGCRSRRPSWIPWCRWKRRKSESLLADYDRSRRKTAMRKSGSSALDDELIGRMRPRRSSASTSSTRRCAPSANGT
ncbi:MAG: hypothetical protein V8T10_00115 [Merdibacter sp.]